MTTNAVRAYFNHGGLARPYDRVARRVKAVEREFAGLLFSDEGVRRFDATLDEARMAAASMLGAAEDGGVSLLPNSSTALNLALSILGATLGSGDLVVTTDQEHPCVNWPLLRLGARGIETVTIGGGSPAGVRERFVAARRPQSPGR